MSDNTRHLLTPMAAIVLPGGQALVSGFVCGVIGGSLAELAGAPPLPWAGVTFGAVSLYAWAVGLSWWRGAIAPQLQAGTGPGGTSETKLELSIDWDQGRAGLFADRTLQTVNL